MTTRSLPDSQPAWRASLLFPVLLAAGFVVAIISTLGAPMIPTIAQAQGVSLETAQWVLTVTLLVGAIATPLNGRLADGPWRRRVLLASLGVVLVGAVISARSSHFAPFIGGRAMQGVGQAIIPLTIATARDFLPRDKVRGAVGILSITTAAGVGLGYPLTGIIAERWDYHAAFWFAALVTGVVLAAVVVVVPDNPALPARPLDLPGAGLLSVGLLALLLPISQGARWGWGSPAVIGLLLAAAGLLALWVWQELRTAHPLVELRLLQRRPVLAANVIAVLMGIGLFAMSSLVNRYVQTPVDAGYGFHSSLVLAGLTLMPLSVGSLLASWLSPRLTNRFGVGLVMAAGAAICGLDMLYLAITRAYRWEIVIATFLLGIGVGLTFALMPALLIRTVPATETGSATGLNQVLRLVGGAFGSAASIAILTGATPAAAAIVPDQGYTVAFAAGGVVCLLAALVSYRLLGRLALATEPSPRTTAPDAFESKPATVAARPR